MRQTFSYSRMPGPGGGHGTTWPSRFARESTFDSRDYDTLDEVTLGKKEYCYGNEGGDYCHGHQELDIDLGTANEPVQTQRDREQFWRVQVDQGGEKLIPGPGEVEDRHNCQRRSRKRQ